MSATNAPNFTARGTTDERWLPRTTQTIDDVGKMPPFFMSLASPSDHWLFISSTGALTAGRRSIDSALFPYRVVDQIHDAAGRVGGRTLVRVKAGGPVWEPFTERSAAWPDVTRSISRSAYGTSITLTERAESLGLEARQTWTTSHERGVIRFFELVALGGEPIEVELIDGVVDVLPALVEPGMQSGLSSLVTAYRRAEWVEPVALFSLGSVPVDRAEPSEALLATSVWTTAHGDVLLSENQIEAFRRGETPRHETRSRGVRGAFLLYSLARVTPLVPYRKAMAMEVEQAADDVERTIAWHAATPNKYEALAADADATERNLAALLAQADALQRTASPAEDARHYANTLYNVMRGGLPIGALIDPIEAARLAADRSDPDAFRRTLTDLPLGFSRRHGDPSRPWNRFSIDVRTEDGELKAGYEGNWRDIFQNWEALGTSFPRLLLPVIVRFLCASTADGYNPYRIDDRQGLDWEVEDPEDPWSHIGYWGDHQIVYLTRLIERLEERFPGALKGLLGRKLLVHADVPYRIKPFDELVRDPHHSVTFDADVAKRVKAREESGLGHGARLVHGPEGDLVRATFEEKLLIPFLVKLSNFAADAGVWMNTQRPEWNDANNALAGFGASMVTTCALLRHTEVLGRLLAGQDLAVTSRTAALFTGIARSLAGASPDAPSRTASERWTKLEAAGRAGESYRAAVYSGTGVEDAALSAADVAGLMADAAAELCATIRNNRRSDGLFHSYNLLQLGTAAGRGSADVARLPVMLEGQASVMSSGLLSADETVELLACLRKSSLYREDLDSYLLYPDRELDGLLDKGVVANADLPLFRALVDGGDRTVVRASVRPDGSSVVRFAPALRSAAQLERALDALPDKLQAGVERDRAAALAGYEESFQHAFFTGRSSTFFGYEGLGCTYWHMVSKLVLSAQETLQRAIDAGASSETKAKLISAYRALRAGIGSRRSAAEYGAFPSEPYSHSPGDGRVRQPGMTGQVKEDLLSRPFELGVRVQAGRITFDGTLVDPAEFLTGPDGLPRPDETPLPLPAGTLGLHLCGIPVIVQAGAHGRDVSSYVLWSDGRREDFAPDAGLSEEASAAIFAREGAVQAVHVALPA